MRAQVSVPKTQEILGFWREHFCLRGGIAKCSDGLENGRGLRHTIDSLNYVSIWTIPLFYTAQNLKY